MRESESASEFDPSSFGVAIYDNVSHQFLDFLMVALLECASGTHLPKIYEIFGTDVLRFLDIFSDTTIRVPPATVLEDAMRDVGIYLSLRDVPLGSRAERVKTLSKRYNLTTGAVRKNFIEAEKRFSRYEISSLAS